MFEGGPLTFNPQLIKVFAERLELGEDEILIPEQPEIMIAYGAALSLDSLYKSETNTYTTGELLDEISKVESMNLRNAMRGDLVNGKNSKRAMWSVLIWVSTQEVPPQSSY